MKQQQPHQHSTQRNFRRKIKTLHSWLIIRFYSPYCWSHSCCQMLRSLIAAAPGRARSALCPVFSGCITRWLWPAPWLSLTWDPVLLPGLPLQSSALSSAPCLCVLCLLTFKPWRLLHTGSKNRPECCNTVWNRSPALGNELMAFLFPVLSVTKFGREPMTWTKLQSQRKRFNHSGILWVLPWGLLHHLH